MAEINAQINIDVNGDDGMNKEPAMLMWSFSDWLTMKHSTWGMKCDACDECSWQIFLFVEKKWKLLIGERKTGRENVANIIDSGGTRMGTGANAAAAELFHFILPYLPYSFDSIRI